VPVDWQEVEDDPVGDEERSEQFTEIDRDPCTADSVPTAEVTDSKAPFEELQNHIRMHWRVCMGIIRTFAVEDI
jgi:hypothetical protein